MKKMLVIGIILAAVAALASWYVWGRLRYTGDDMPAIGTTAESWANNERVQQLPPESQGQ